ncbi:hypothetical protein [Dactylosporangium sp. NPDC048998]|uniref:hypothetical protein n=1 Tax=Dactylosporangium sp. NPDC048998 TaxID=3363976 RepID=UPI00371DADD1
MARWSLPNVVSIPDLGPLAESISQETGESKAIHPLSRDKQWLAKLYRTPLPADAARHLTDLIHLPGAAAESDRTLIAGSTSWPVAAITDGARTVGCVIPAASDRFFAEFRRPQSEPNTRIMEIDFLAANSAAFARRGLAAVTLDDRIAVCRNLVAVATMLARYELVYSDWSYSNVLWSLSDRTVFVIDIDGSVRGRKPNVHQPNWDDPLTGRADPADLRTDCYRVALLVARCLTGERDRDRTLHALVDLQRPGLSAVLLDILLCTDRNRRPNLSTLVAALDGNPYVRFPVPRGPMPPRPAPVTPPTPKPAARPKAAPKLAPKPASKPVVRTGPSNDNTMSTPAAVVAVVVVVLSIVLLIIAIANS